MSTRETRPYPDPFRVSERAVIENALQQGVLALKESRKFDVTTEDEVSITKELHVLLNRMLESKPPVVPGFTKQIFQTVVRGNELSNHNDTKAEKRPDLTFRSVRPLPNLAHPDQCALIVECKIVGKSHPMSLYCPEGVRRFVDGTYAWAVASAMMLGYARDAYAPDPHLHAHLSERMTEYNMQGVLAARGSTAPSPKVYLTVHARKINGMPRGRRGWITLHHLWIPIDRIAQP